MNRTVSVLVILLVVVVGAPSAAGQPKAGKTVDDRLGAVTDLLRPDAPPANVISGLRLLAEVAIELGNKAALPPSFRQHMTAAQASLKKEPLPEAEIMKALVAAYRSVSADQPFKVSEEVRAKGALPFTLDLVASVRRQARQAACDGCAKRLVEAMLLILTPIETGVAGPAQESEAAARTVVRW